MSATNNKCIPAAIPVIDPMNRTGKLTVPMALVEVTRGVTEFIATPVPLQKDLSLCLLFQKGRCNAGVKCHQIHVNRDFVADTRASAATNDSCCAMHGDVNSQTLANTLVRVEVSSDTGASVYPLASFAKTSALDALLKGCACNAVVRISTHRLCRLHSQARCKFGKDCKNIHLCRTPESACQSNKSTPAPEPLLLSPTTIPMCPSPAGHDISLTESISEASSVGGSKQTTPRRTPTMSSHPTPLRRAAIAAAARTMSGLGRACECPMSPMEPQAVPFFLQQPMLCVGASPSYSPAACLSLGLDLERLVDELVA